MQVWWHTPVPNVQCKTPDDRQRNCPKHVEFLDKNKPGKTSESVGFIKKQDIKVTLHRNALITWHRDTARRPNRYNSYMHGHYSPRKIKLLPTPRCFRPACRKSTDIQLATQSLHQRTNKAGNVHSCQQKSISLKFSKAQTGNDVRYSCHHNSSRFTFPVFAHSYRFSILHSLQSITPRIY